ncbi:hypothetical protein, conserved [Eimeria tenella]|uniref:Uncharacterized protein n=1 Tax=Eimeria tenella TaxID=5802 RepID=U6L140_EIMTE|nr:hypothetical protein, conserved [Eimeria tenella]CDJ42319.1 hypothetical protein, conserved [Eimeria tenella]|eukprot:XP_013233069.1 hypothetical protein, conserved [Eimeria tenella]
MQEYISKALLSTQIVRLQQCLTDIEFLRAKHYLILRDLGVIAEQMKILRKITRRQGRYIAGVEAAIQHVNNQIEEVQARKEFISFYLLQDPMHARQQLEQNQLLDLGMDIGLNEARRAVVDPRAYIPESRLDITQWEDLERRERVIEQRQRHLRENTPPPSLHAARKKQMKKDRPAVESPTLLPPAPLSPRFGIAGLGTSPSAPRRQTVLPIPGEPPWKAFVTPQPDRPSGPARGQSVDSDDEDDWDTLRQQYGGTHQGTFELREKGGEIVLVKPFPEAPTEGLPMATITQPRRRQRRSSVKNSDSEKAESPSPRAAVARPPATSPAAGASSPIPVTDFFNEDEGPRPKTNAPEIAEERERETKIHSIRVTLYRSSMET